MQITGSIDEIRFRNDDNGYTIIVLDANGEPIICAGNFPPVSEGEHLTLGGEFMVHPKFGKQFKVAEVKVSTPDSLDGIVRYLGSGLIKGVGPRTALSIVSRFGERTLEVIEFNPSQLTQIKGLSKAKAAEIAAAYSDIKQMRDSMVFLQGNGLTLNLSLKIYKQYGAKTTAIIKSNPFKLIEDIDGVGFVTADKIASKMGVLPDSPFRARAGVIYCLKESADRNGNTYLPREELIPEVGKLLCVPEKSIDNIIDLLIIEHKIKEVKSDNGMALMLIPVYRAEKNAGLNLIKLTEHADRVVRDCHDEIAEFEKAEGIKFHEQQREAIMLAVNSGVTVITGGPGTGKTTIIKCILHIFNMLNLKCALMAPTGRAAKRLSESTGEGASTIHRALMLNKSSDTAGEPLSANVCLVDEVSMVDIFLLNTLLTRLPTGTKLVLVGDADQLPSVGAGNVLKDIMESGLIKCARLNKIYRQAGQSLIIANAHAINNGEMPELKRNDADFFYSKGRTAEEVAEIAVSMAADRIPKFLKVEPYRVQVLCPVKNGAAGSIAINKMLQERLNGTEARQLLTDDFCFKKGDKVMHIANNYNLEWRKLSTYETGEGVFNGDLGVIYELREGSGEIDVLLEDGRLVTYTHDVRTQLILAYAITVHKSQGSEFDAVIVPIYGANPVLMTRNLLYTAITRAKKLVVLVGDEYHIKRMVDNNYIAKRFSMLGRFIKQGRKDMLSLYEGDENYEQEAK